MYFFCFVHFWHIDDDDEKKRKTFMDGFINPSNQPTQYFSQEILSIFVFYSIYIYYLYIIGIVEGL